MSDPFQNVWSFSDFYFNRKTCLTSPFGKIKPWLSCVNKVRARDCQRPFFSEVILTVTDKFRWFYWRYKYTYMEEMLGNIAGARQVFERWMEWRPEEQAWHSYINFELRYKEVDRARTIYERYILQTGLPAALPGGCGLAGPRSHWCWPRSQLLLHKLRLYFLGT